MFSVGLYYSFNLDKLRYDLVINKISVKYNLFIGYKYKIYGEIYIFLVWKEFGWLFNLVF